MRNRSIAGALLGAALLVGCGAQPGHTLMTYSRSADRPPGTTHASVSADYALYPSDAVTPIKTVHLDEGDTYGFVTGTDNKVVAIARDQEIPLTAKLATSYYWKLEK